MSPVAINIAESPKLSSPHTQLNPARSNSAIRSLERVDKTRRSFRFSDSITVTVAGRRFSALPS
jgi:hypothetical protein